MDEGERGDFQSHKSDQFNVNIFATDSETMILKISKQFTPDIFSSHA